MQKVNRKIGMSANKQALEHIIEQQQDEICKLKYIINELPGSIYWKDRDGIYLGRNCTSAESLKAMNFSDDVIGKTDYDLFPKNMADQFRLHDLEVIETAKEISKEEISYLSSGDEIIQLSTKCPLYDREGRIIGIVGNTVDITKLKKVEADFKSAQAEFIQNMEHDIRTPFNGVWGIASIMAENENDPEKKAMLLMIVRCTKELLDYCNSILDFSKIESGSLPLISKKFNLRELIDGVLALEQPPAKLKNLKLDLEYDVTIPTVIIGDDYRLQRTLINLLSNAIKFTNEGHIKLIVAMQKEMKNRNIILTFTVEDTGIGIQDSEQMVIFEKFTRLTLANKSSNKGQGLGLHIVKQFIEEMNGDIEVVSKKGRGSKFICTLKFKIPLINE